MGRIAMTMNRDEKAVRQSTEGKHVHTEKINPEQYVNMGDGRKSGVIEQSRKKCQSCTGKPHTNAYAMRARKDKL